ncbi:hypothetical protein ODC36_003477 [Salmonella enterica]|nr:hypothetical protein [Salmonella enterica]EJX0325876.1 hypothetical protein [Salmonella enterica]EJX0330066.1 hypothetical protein [Salmonella enterica]EJX0336840.1 hypothetical protein [Salmonella enterica]EJX0668826.1 hypothetical protein [Salmonella enterica]
MDADLLNKYLWTVKKQAIAFISSILLLVAYKTTESLEKSYDYYLLNGNELVLIRKVPDKGGY